MPVPAAIAIGSNLGDRAAHVEHAFEALRALSSRELIARSSVHETDPVGPAGQGPYLNAAAVIRVELEPRALLDALLAIEKIRGRDRREEERWGPRTLDLDLLLYDDREIDEPGLTVPHPHLHERLFVLEPLGEIAPEWAVPGRDATVGQLRTRVVYEKTTKNFPLTREPR